ncbi:MAG: CPBP family intramembrane metalloprotease [Bacteroidales bacterium]|nr:CPBP family intramembrane metalloprotease [Bacteroidales bacterium]
MDIGRKHFFDGKSYGVQLLYLLLFLLTGLLIFSLLAQGCAMLVWGDTSALTGKSQIHYYWLTQLIGSLGAWLLPALIFGFLATGTVYSYSKADKIPNMKSVLLVILLALAILPVVGVLAYWNEQIHLPESMAGLEEVLHTMEDNSNKVLESLMSAQGVGVLLANILILGALPAICEEFFFRGAMQPLFERWTGNKHIAIIITAFIFSAVHFQFFGFVPRFLLGVYLGYLFVWSRSIWLSATAHFMHNSLSVIVAYFTTQNGIDTDTMGWGEYIPHIIVSLFVVAYGIFLLYKMRVKEVCVESVGEKTIQE